MICIECGGVRTHKKSCKYAKNSMLSMAEEWFRRFGHDEAAISPTGRAYFAWLLVEVKASTSQAQEHKGD